MATGHMSDSGDFKRYYEELKDKHKLLVSQYYRSVPVLLYLRLLWGLQVLPLAMLTAH